MQWGEPGWFCASPSSFSLDRSQHGGQCLLSFSCSCSLSSLCLSISISLLVSRTYLQALSVLHGFACYVFFLLFLDGHTTALCSLFLFLNVNIPFIPFHSFLSFLPPFLLFIPSFPSYCLCWWCGQNHITALEYAAWHGLQRLLVADYRLNPNTVVCLLFLSSLSIFPQFSILINHKHARRRCNVTGGRREELSSERETGRKRRVEEEKDEKRDEAVGEGREWSWFHR